MEKINGWIKKADRRSSEQTLDMGRRHSNRSPWHFWLILICLLSLTGCGSLKSSLMSGAATTAVVGATSLIPGGVIVPAIAGGATSAVVSAVTAPKISKGEPLNVTADTVIQEAPANFWTLLGQLIEMGGWALILIVIVPMVFSWLMPGPIKFKGREKKNGS
tara:strand:+ start:120 stop:605 length:486 start_codon:yes stop_codon:yes gene_type:complete